MGKGEGRRAGQARQREGKSDAGKGNEDGPSVREIGGMNVRPERDREN